MPTLDSDMGTLQGQRVKRSPPSHDPQNHDHSDRPPGKLADLLPDDSIKQVFPQMLKHYIIADAPEDLAAIQDNVNEDSKEMNQYKGSHTFTFTKSVLYILTVFVFLRLHSLVLTHGTVLFTIQL